MYKKLVNPYEDEVSKLLQEGYTLHSTNAVPKTFKEKFTNELWIIYHFIKYPKYEPTNYVTTTTLYNQYVNNTFSDEIVESFKPRNSL